jgi:hypothetical protein
MPKVTSNKPVSKSQAKRVAAQQGKPSYANGSTAAPARARAVPAPEPTEDDEQIQQEETQQIPDEGEAVATSGDEVFDFSTDELEDPRTPKPDALRVRVTGVEEFYSQQKNSPAILFGLTCDDLNKEINFKVFVPRSFVEDLRVSPKALSKGEWDESVGRKVGNESAQYAIAIHNKNNTAVLDRFRTIAKAQGRSLENVAAPSDFSEFVGLLNEFLGPQNDTYVELVVLRRANRKTGFLEIRQLLEPELIDTKPNIFDSYRKSWQAGEEN